MDTALFGFNRNGGEIPSQSMQRIAPLLLALLLACGSLPIRSETIPHSFVGQWHGVEIAADDGFGISADKLTLQIFPLDEGFRLIWSSPDNVQKNASFTPTGQSGVFTASLPKRGFRDIFTPSKKTDPLAGDPLLWVRIEGISLVIYSMTIDRHGAYTLDRTHATLRQDSLLIRFSRRAHGEIERVLVAQFRRGEQ